MIETMNDAKIGGKIVKALMLPGERLADGMTGWKSLSDGDKAELIASARQHPEQIGL